ncbi:MAG TPA: phosphoglycerate kinase [Solirubrobacteraceae bacterium]|nr:phosphoglycerate kinase [Solirubrobacteraceae bacterium]
MPEMRTLEDLDVDGRRVLLRADLNVPLRADAGTVSVADDTRIRAALSTIEELARRGARIVLVSHLGRPRDREPELSMRPVADRVRELSGAHVSLASAVVGEEVEALTEHLARGEILVLENVRYEAGETKNDPELARALAELADVYVNDAFGTAHRAHASTEGVAHLLPCAAGRLMEREVRALTGILERPARPLVAVLGGAKVTDKIALVEHFLDVADSVLIGGAMSFPFLAARGHAVGASPCLKDDVDCARQALRKAAETHHSLELPEDLIVAARLSAEAKRHTTDSPDVPGGWLGLDIGPLTAARYGRAIQAAGTVFWNGPMGAFECEPFALGTRVIAQALAGTSATTVVGGGETVEALRELGLESSVNHVSTGGGATLELLQGLSLPGVEALSAGAREPDDRGAQLSATDAGQLPSAGALR